MFSGHGPSSTQLLAQSLYIEVPCEQRSITSVAMLNSAVAHRTCKGFMNNPRSQNHCPPSCTVRDELLVYTTSDNDPSHCSRYAFTYQHKQRTCNAIGTATEHTTAATCVTCSHTQLLHHSLHSPTDVYGNSVSTKPERAHPKS